MVRGGTHRYPHGAVIHEVFGQVAAADPAATAIIHRAVPVSYGELDRRSDALAAQLAARGVRSGHLIPVLVPRSPHWVVALLAVLKCGAGYAALDPNWPDERISRLLARLRPPLAVVAAAHAGRLRGGPVHALPDSPAGPESQSGLHGPPARPPRVPVGGEAISTVFLTSGSSGEPKAVLSPHRATVRMFVDCQFARFDRSTVMPQGSPLPWDGASLELWGPLLTGGTSVLLDEPHLQPALLRELIDRDGVNTAFITTSLFNVLVEEDLAAFRGLRAVMTGGERVSVFHYRRFRQAHPGIDLISAYGPVESTIFTTTHPVTDADVAGEAIPLGRPVHDTAVVVLDGDRACRPGELGEICIAGAGLATGYLGDPELTASRFVRLTVDGTPTRLYRTGDFGHLSAEGVLHFAGRRDRQVKVHGHRIEPEEVERHLLAVPGITRGVVIPVRGRTGAYEKLAAFYTTGPDGPAPERVGSVLRDRLPGYLMPAAIRHVARIPVSATGKADYAQLLATLAAPDDRAGGEPPRDDLERAVAAEFAAVLGTSPIGRDTAFFDAGGTSLDALRLCSRLADRLGRPVLQSRLLAAPTVAALAAGLRGVAVRPARRSSWSDRTGVPLLPMQQAFWLTSVLEPASAAGQCVSVWRRVEVRPDVLAQALADVRHRHPGLRTRIRLADRPLATVVDGPGPLPIDLLPPAADPLGALLDRLHEPFDSERGPLFRAALAAEPAGPGWLFGLAVHHACYDEWAEQLVVEDLRAAVAARAAGRAPSFAGPVPSLAEVYDCYQAQLELADLDGQRAYWRQQLHDAPRLPALTPDTPVRAGRCVDPVTVTLPAGTVARLADLARGQGGAASHAVLAVLAEAVCSVTGAADLVIGVATAKRGHPILASAVTCLLDSVCVRLRQCGSGLPATLAQCRPALADALRNQDVSVAELSGLAGAGPARGRPPYDLLFVRQHRPHPRLWSGEPVPLFQPTSREMVAEARPQPDGGLTLALLHADRPGLRGTAERIAAAVGRIATAGCP